MMNMEQLNQKFKKQIRDCVGEITTVEKMKEGRCNDVYCVIGRNGKFIIKIATGEIRQQELDTEYSLMKEFEQIVNLPKVLIYNKDETLSFLLMEFIDGIKPTVFSDGILKLMAKTLKKIHKSSINDEFVDFNKLIEVAETNMNCGRLDLDEFKKDGKIIAPQTILEYLKKNMPKVKACRLHGDYRPKNLIIKDNDVFVLDWGLSFVGDPYYDLSIIKWYFTDEQFNKFIKFYGITKLNEKRLKYNEWLSAFLNV